MNILSTSNLKIDLTARQFGQWEVLGYAGRSSDVGKKGGDSFWHCRCGHCGSVRLVRGSQLTEGRSTWCGNKSSRKAHPLYETYCQMIRRCYFNSTPAFKNYGGRGIQVCDAWRNDFWQFVSDVGEKPEGGSIDRINNDGNYEPSNFRWATPLIQGQNKRNNTFITHEGRDLRSF